MLNNLVIRPIQEGDREEYLAMAADFYDSEAVLSPVPMENLVCGFETFLGGSPYGDAFLFEAAGRVLGYGVLAYTFSQEAGGRVVWIEEIYIKTEHRGKGIGSRFLDFVKETVPARRYRLETEPDNEGAAALYRRKDFSPFPYVNYKLDK